VEDAEGATVVAPVVLALTEDRSISNAPTGLDFPQADAAGRLSLSQTYSFDLQDPAQAAIFGELRDRFTGREVQLHGLELPATVGEGTAGEVNGTAGYKANLPVANGILLPFENTGLPVLNRLYDAALDREPDLPGLVYHAALLGPFSAGQLAAGVLASPEWQERFGADTASDAAFVQQVYRNALERDADAAALDFWTGALNRGTSRADVLVAISEGPEHNALVSDFALASRIGDLLLGV
jgi:hypothetical protein